MSKNKIVTIVIVVIVLAVCWAFGYWGYTKYMSPAGEVTDNKVITANFACDEGKMIEAKFNNVASSSVDLKFSDGREMNLPQAMSASGARYANADESIVFWNKGDTAFVTEGEATTFANCLVKQAKDASL